MVDERALSAAERQCLADTLTRLKYYSANDVLETIGEPMTGVAGQSRVFRILVRRRNGTSQNFVAKFDPKRTAKEWQALAAMNQSDFPHNFVSNVDGAVGLEAMPAENGLIVYKAANTLAANDELLTLHKLLIKHGTGKPGHCQSVLGKVMDVLGQIYQDGKRDLVNGTWTKFFKEIEENKLDLYQCLAGHRAAAAIQAVEKQVGHQKLSPIHGDLNLTNVLVAVQADQPKDVMIIDFADYQLSAPLVLDFVKLETELWLETAAVHWDEPMDPIRAKAQGELQLVLPALIADPSKVTCSVSALKCYAQLAAILRHRAQKHLGMDSFNKHYGLPLAFAFLRALTYKSVKSSPFKTELAKLGLEAAWQLAQGATNSSATIDPGSAAPLPQDVQDREFRALILGKLVGILKRACMQPFLAGFHRHFGGTGSASDLATTVGQMMLDKSVLEVQACLISVFADSDIAETRQAWDQGESLVGWRVLAHVNPHCCSNLREGAIFHVPLQTLLGVEVVLSWHDKRPVALEQRAGSMVGRTSVAQFVESGPNDLDFVEAVARELFALLNLPSERPDLERLCKLVDGALQVARSAGSPYYLVADLSKDNHPLSAASTQSALRQFLPNLAIAYLRRAGATDLNLLVVGEDQLEGAITYYLNQKRNWHLNHA